MKQYITIEQLNELSDKGKGSLKKWVESKRTLYLARYSPAELTVISLPILGIGPMIEFLMDHTDKRKLNKHFENVKNSTLTSRTGLYFSDFANTRFFIDRDMTCDNLWEAVKEILKTHET